MPAKAILEDWGNAPASPLFGLWDGLMRGSWVRGREGRLSQAGSCVAQANQQEQRVATPSLRLVNPEGLHRPLSRDRAVKAQQDGGRSVRLICPICF